MQITYMTKKGVGVLFSTNNIDIIIKRLKWLHKQKIEAKVWNGKEIIGRVYQEGLSWNWILSNEK